MASTLSNLYVEKASSEHPIALWMLNEQVDYVSQITEDERQFQLFATWEIENAEAFSETSTSINAPFPDSATSRIKGEIPATPTMDVIARSQFLLSDNLVESLSNFNTGFYVYFDTALCNSVSFGYQYTNVETSAVVEVLDTVLVRKTDKDKWKFFSGTFDLPPGPLVAEDVKLLIKFNIRQDGAAGDYDFLINGLSVGQWSEDFNKISYGVEPGSIPAGIALPESLKALPAYPYGASGDNGYYLSQGYQLFAKNFGVPLVFGSSNVTKILPNVLNNVNYPSLIFPGYGFLNERGRHNDYTVEMWLRVNSSAVLARKIFGPITGDDGLYADGAYLTFKIGDEHGSHFVGEWFRPMLIHIRILQNSAIVLLNGEEVISLDIDTATVSLPEQFNDLSKNQDYVGFWAYQDVDPVDIDNFSIYSYGMPTEVAKRRWVWGQAVTAPEQTNSSINSITAYNDYAFANYASNYNYPDFANWKQAFYSNVNAGDKSLGLPDYKLPRFEIQNNTLIGLFDDTDAIEQDPLDYDDVSGNKYLTLNPNSSWNSDAYFMHFEKLGVLDDPVVSIYGIFKTDGTASQEVLFKINNKFNGDKLSVILNGTSVQYSVTLSGVTTVISNKTIQANKKFTVGLNLDKLALTEIPEINRFLSDQSAIDLYLAGDGISKFTGKIYKFGFDAAYNNRKISVMSDSSGIFYTNLSYSITAASQQDANITYTTSTPHGYNIGDVITVSGITSTPSGVFNLSNKEITAKTANTFTIVDEGYDMNNLVTKTYTSGGNVVDNSNSLFNHTANYTLTAIKKYGIFFADIAVAGYWEDYMPLSYFSKAIVDYDGNTNYEIDSIQFNQDFPEPPTSSAAQTISQWFYSDLQIEYSNPTILTYADLNNSFYTKWENYLEMSQNSVKTDYYDTVNSALRSYVSFQYIKDGANNNLLDFANYLKPRTSGILDPESTSSDWRNTAYEVTTGTVIYPPKTTTKTTVDGTKKTNIDFNDVAIVYHLDFKSEGILHQQIRFRELQLASHVLERTDFTPVGSRFGIPVYYYSRSGIYYDLKAKNPISTYKRSTPYLYLNRQSGWKLRGEFNSLTDRGLAIPINLSKAEKQEVSSIQMWLRFSESKFPEDPVMIFSIEHNDGIYDFYINGDSSTQRGYIFGVNRETNEILDTVGYYVNGQSVYKPFMTNEDWMVLGLEFNDLLNFSSRSGKISLNGPLTYNNVSYNLATNIEKDEAIETRIWTDIEGIEKAAAITSVTKVGTSVTYKTDKLLVAKQVPKRVLVDNVWTAVPGQFDEVGDIVTIAGATPAAYNLVNARVVSVDPVNMTFTVISPTTITENYVSGGQVSSSGWRDVQDSLEVITDDVPPYNWGAVKIISQSRTFSIDPKAIYEKYTGSNRIVIDDESSGILVKPEKFRAYSEVSWSENTKIAV